MRFTSVVALVLAVGCGKVVAPHAPDARVDSGTVDSGVDATLAGTVHVTVLDVIGNGAPAANIPVIFINPDGTIATDTTSDSNGRAEGTVLPGASVTAVWLQATRYLVATIDDIKPGDDLPLGFTDRDSTSNGTLLVTFPPLTNATAYEIFTPCGGIAGTPSTTNTITLRNNCRPATFDVYVLATVNGVQSQVAQVQGVTPASGSVTVPSNWTPFATFSSTYTDVPAEITTVSLAHLSGSPGGFYNSSSGTPSNTQLAVSLSVPLAGAKAIVTSSFARADALMQQVSQRIVGNSINYTLDVGTNLLPWMTGVTFDPASHSFAATTEGPNTPYDVYGVDLTYQRASTSFEWLVLAPTIAPITLPTLPDHVGPVLPQATDTLAKPTAVLVDANTLSGWDATRPVVFDLIDSFSQDNTFDLLHAEIMFGK